MWKQAKQEARQDVRTVRRVLFYAFFIALAVLLFQIGREGYTYIVLIGDLKELAMETSSVGKERFLEHMVQAARTAGADLEREQIQINYVESHNRLHIRFPFRWRIDLLFFEISDVVWIEDTVPLWPHEAAQYR